MHCRQAPFAGIDSQEDPLSGYITGRAILLARPVIVLLLCWIAIRCTPLLLNYLKVLLHIANSGTKPVGACR